MPAKVTAHMTMSLDGFIAHDDDLPGHLFDWYAGGPVTLASANPQISFQLDEAGAEVMRAMMTRIGGIVSGRHLFDITNGWSDNHPIGAPVVVVTHTPPADADRWPRTTFSPDVATGIATAQELAGDREVVIASPTIACQALELGLVDEVAVSLAPVLLGGGKSFFGSLGREVLLDDPTVVPGRRATHLFYGVRK